MTNTATNIPEGFESTRGSIVFQNPANWAKLGEECAGRMVHGTFEGKLEKDPYGKENYKFTALTAGTTVNKDGEEIEYDIGATVIINASGSLDAKMKGVAEGSEVIVDFDGKVKITKGPFKGKLANTYSVYVKSAQ